MQKDSRIFGITSEFNPFHHGHEYVIKKSREKGATHIVCAMSGNFVQRGETAIFNKWLRAKAAIKCGADLVIELPTPYAMSGAEKFANSAVSLFNALSCVDSISFGAETEDISALTKIASFLLSDEFSIKIKKEMEKSISFANARTNIIKESLGESYADIIKTPNNILAIEYIKSIILLKNPMGAVAIKRINGFHDSDEANGFSASAIRNAIINKTFDKKMLPQKAYDIFKDENFSSLEKLETAVLAYLRSISSDKLKNLSDISEGIENKIILAAKEATSLDELYSLIKSKRYSHARIRRLVLSAFLQIENIDYDIPYVKVLAFNDKGAEILREIKEKSDLPIITKHSDAQNLEGFAKELYEQEIRLTDIYSLSLNKILPCGEEQRHSAFYNKNP